MGFPMIQVVMIAARQVSKPVADAVISYSKGHPTFRAKILLPVGRFLVQFTRRLRMKKLGLGEDTKANISESAALEQASDFVQQAVIFVYSVSVFAAYYAYSKYTTEETVKAEEYKQLQEEFEKLRAIVQENKRLIAELSQKTDSVFSKVHPVLTEKMKNNATSTDKETNNLENSRLTFAADQYLIPVDDALLMLLTEAT